MRKRLIKNNIVNNSLILESNNLDEIYDMLPSIIKICKDKYNVVIKYDGKEIKDDDYKNIDDEKIIDIIEVIHAINLKDKYERYNYIYDVVCAKLDEKISTNYCGFKDNICIKYRLKNQNHENGCCDCKGRGKCPYLIDGVCTLKTCMACKLFTCHTLKKLGINQNINDFILTKYFFTEKQKDILRFSYWIPKEEVLNRLMNNTYIRSKGYSKN